MLIGYKTSTAYLHLIVAIVWLWDATLSISCEIETIGPKVSLPNIAYILSRIATGGLAIGNLAHSVIQGMDQCNGSITVVAWLSAIASPLNALLFLIRALAVFRQSRRLSVMFALLWVTTLTSLCLPFSFYHDMKNSRGCCILGREERTGAVGLISVVLFDTTVFVAIAHQMFNLDKLNKTARSNEFYVERTCRVSRVLLTTGYIYYFPIITLNAAAMIILLSSSISPQYQSVAVSADIIFQNILACYVFRLLRLRVLRGGSGDHWGDMLSTIVYDCSEFSVQEE